jgi:hypothetical protein
LNLNVECGSKWKAVNLWSTSELRYHPIERRQILATAKEHIAEIIKRQPDDSSYDDIVRELAFDLMVQRGLKDSDERHTISNEEMKRRIKTWQK